VTPDVSFRPATPDDLLTCAGIWRIAINDYTAPLGQPPVPDDLASIGRLYGHLQATDPERFVVATLPDGGAPNGERIVAFVVATMRDRVWFLSMLFVLPDYQGRGLGRALLDRVMPAPSAGTARATGTDTAQPISNALYAGLGIVPRMPLFNLIGVPDRPEAFGSLPGGSTARSFEAVASDGDGHRRLAATVDGLDRELNGFTHPMDHRFLRQQERHGWLYEAADGTVLGYGYSAESGRLGPVLVRDPDLLAPVLGHLTAAVQPRGAFITWVPGHAERALVPLLRAGFRLDTFPVLLCWDRPVADFERYLPISPGLL
jgi:GNAT superfamily N-acetyltransferase